jgi:hypothetical protein
MTGVSFVSSLLWVLLRDDLKSAYGDAADHDEPPWLAEVMCLATVHFRHCRIRCQKPHVVDLATSRLGLATGPAGRVPVSAEGTLRVLRGCRLLLLELIFASRLAKRFCTSKAFARQRDEPPVGLRDLCQTGGVLVWQRFRQHAVCSLARVTRMQPFRPHGLRFRRQLTRDDLPAALDHVDVEELDHVLRYALPRYGPRRIMINNVQGAAPT